MPPFGVRAGPGTVVTDGPGKGAAVVGTVVDVGVAISEPTTSATAARSLWCSTIERVAV